MRGPRRVEVGFGPLTAYAGCFGAELQAQGYAASSIKSRLGLLDHLNIDKAIFVGHDWGGFIVWQMPLRHKDRVAGVIGVNTPHTNRSPADPILWRRSRSLR